MGVRGAGCTGAGIWLAGGLMVFWSFAGRADGQIKLRGFRIEPGEIEAALSSHASVGQCAVLAREDVAGQKRLVGYVVSAGGVVADAGELRAHLSGRLPEYMVPSAFVFLGRFPLTPNGKLDRGGLPAPEREGGVKRAARTPQEALLCGLYGEVLGVTGVGIDESFFALGGDSIMSIQLVSRARRAGLLLTPRAVFEHQTVAGLAGVARSLAEPGSGGG